MAKSSSSRKIIVEESPSSKWLARFHLEREESSSQICRSQTEVKVSGDSSSLLSEEQLLCSICLDVFTDPVTTSCGHNFCKSCLTQCWEKSQHCPLCKEEFTKKPELKINTTLREVADHFKKKSAPEKSEVLCDICNEEKMKALKSCLDCGMTFCKIHLDPHNHVPKLMKHKLIIPVKNLEDYICQKHERPLEMFCRDDQTCVCQFCTETDHKNHNTVPIEEESRERKTQLGKSQTDAQQMIQERMKKIQEIKNSVEISKRDTEKEKADSVEVFTALIRSIERSQAELLQVMEEKQKAAETQAEELIKELEQEITALKRRTTELEQLSHTEEHLHLLQVYSSMCSPPHTKNWTEISINTPLNGDTVRTALSQLQKTLNEKLTKTLEDNLKETGEGYDSAQTLYRISPPLPRFFPRYSRTINKTVKSSEIRIRDPNQGGRDITEELFFAGRKTSKPI